MEKKKVAFIVIPPGQESLNFSLSHRFLWFLGGVAGFFFILVISSVVSLGFLAKQVHKVQSLERENMRLTSEMSKVTVLSEELAHSKSKLNQILSIMGADSITTQQGNMGNNIFTAGMPQSRKTAMELESQFSSPEVYQAFARTVDAQRAVPSIWPTQGIVSQEFSWSDGYGKKHPGLDIACTVGTPISATGDGQIIMADWDNALGHTVMIDHKNGYYSLYGHNSRLLVSNGATVKRGQTIALSGNSGRSSAPHLHYEIRKAGSPINPRDFLTN